MVEDIASIPTFVIDGHQEAYHLWKKQGFVEKTLVHVDAHSDMWDVVHRSHAGVYEPNCGNYILPALKEGMVDSVWWINPFSVSQYCLNLVEKSVIPLCDLSKGARNDWVHWDNEQFGNRVSDGEGFENYDLPKIKGEKYILDIDLDAFSCCAGIPFVEFPHIPTTGSESYRSAEQDFQPRIARVLETLLELERPEMIVIAESQEKKCTFISPKYVSPVKKELVKGLTEVFSR